MIATEKMGLVVEQHHVPTGMPRYGNDQQIGSQGHGIPTRDLMLHALGIKAEVLLVENAFTAEVVMKFLVVGDIVLVGEKEVADPAPGFQGFDQRRGKAGGVHQDIALRVTDQVAGGSIGRAGVVATVKHGPVDRNGKGLLDPENIRRGGNRADGLGGTGEEGLEGGAAFFGIPGLMKNGGLCVYSVEHRWGHPPAGITINAGAIHIKFTADIVGTALLQSGHRDPPRR
jgi:hypothetical protein